MLRHGLHDFIYDVFTHNLEYIKTIPWPVRLNYCIGTLKTLSGSQMLVWIFSAIGFVMLSYPNRLKYFCFWRQEQLRAWSASA